MIESKEREIRILSKKIVVIEDDQKNMKLFRAILNKMENITLLTEIQGEKGLKLIKNEMPDLVILVILSILLYILRDETEARK